MTTLVSLLDCLPILHPSVKVHVWDLNFNWNWVFQSSTSTQPPTDTLPPTKNLKTSKRISVPAWKQKLSFLLGIFRKSFRQLDFHSNCWNIHPSMMHPHWSTHSSTMPKLQWEGIVSTCKQKLSLYLSIEQICLHKGREVGDASVDGWVFIQLNKLKLVFLP